MDKLELPKDEVGEKGLLCSIIQNTAILLENENVLADNLFQVPANQRIFFAIRKLAPHFSEIDFKTLRGEFDAKELKEIGDLDYLNEIFGFVPTASNWEYYFTKAFDAERLRKAQLGALEILKLRNPRGAGEAAEIAEEALRAIAAPNIKPPVSFREQLHTTLDWLEQLATTPPESIVRFGISGLDDALQPIEPSNQIVICADTGRGKSALAAQAVLSTLDRSFAIFSLEMPVRALITRILATESKVPFGDLRRGRIRDGDYTLVTQAVTRLSNRNIWIEDQHPISAHTIATKCRQYKRTGLDCIIVDYLQLVAPGANRRDNREREVAEISRALKSLALELDIVVIALSQLNDSGQLRESRAIGQDADIVLHIYQDEDGYSIQVRKHRNGPRCSIPVTFNGAFMRFFDRKKNVDQRAVKLPYQEEVE
jgi:replicative DNA helicase